MQTLVKATIHIIISAASRAATKAVDVVATAAAAFLLLRFNPLWPALHCSTGVDGEQTHSLRCLQLAIGAPRDLFVLVLRSSIFNLSLSFSFVAHIKSA